MELEIAATELVSYLYDRWHFSAKNYNDKLNSLKTVLSLYFLFSDLQFCEKDFNLIFRLLLNGNQKLICLNVLANVMKLKMILLMTKLDLGSKALRNGIFTYNFRLNT